MDNRTIKLLEMVITNEGGYGNIPGDTGGETYRGISRKWYPKWPGWKIVDKAKPLKNGKVIKNPELEQDIREFYYDNFMKPNNVEQVKDNLIAAHLYDFGVNAGIKTAAIILQRSINKVCSPDIKADGVIGPKTIALLNGKYADKIARQYISDRIARYKDIVRRRPANKKFLKGWLNRVNNVTAAAKNIG